MAEIDFVQTLLQATEAHKQEILQRLDEHKQDTDRKLLWQDRRLLLVERAQNRLEQGQEKLVESTNHKVDAVLALIADNKREAQNALLQKADRNQLLTSIGFRLMNVGPLRWILGAALAAGLATAAANHWFIRAAEFVEGLI